MWWMEIHPIKKKRHRIHTVENFKCISGIRIFVKMCFIVCMVYSILDEGFLVAQW